jgi:type III pantothenate kinase
MSEPRDWLLELGHSRLKLARRVGGEVRRIEVVPVAAFQRWLAATAPTGSADRFWLAAVPLDDVVAAVTEALEQRRLDWRRITTGRPALEVAPGYPGLGVDRWLALQPPCRRFDGAFCVIDAGTATTIDLVDEQRRHRGGWIVPGRIASRDGLLARAPGLRREAGDADSLAPALSTDAAIERGLLLQQVGAVERALIEARALAGGSVPSVVLTGGDAPSLQSFLDGAVFESDLVLQGLSMAAGEAVGT